MARINQFICNGRRFGQNAKPTERIDALINFQEIGWNRGARHAMEAITAGNEAAIHTVALSVFFIRDVG